MKLDHFGFKVINDGTIMSQAVLGMLLGAAAFACGEINRSAYQLNSDNLMALSYWLLLSSIYALYRGFYLLPVLRQIKQQAENKENQFFETFAAAIAEFGLRVSAVRGGVFENSQLCLTLPAVSNRMQHFCNNMILHLLLEHHFYPKKNANGTINIRYNFAMVDQDILKNKINQLAQFNKNVRMLLPQLHQLAALTHDRGSYSIVYEKTAVADAEPMIAWYGVIAAHYAEEVLQHYRELIGCVGNITSWNTENALHHFIFTANTPLDPALFQTKLHLLQQQLNLPSAPKMATPINPTIAIATIIRTTIKRNIHPGGWRRNNGCG